MYLCEGQTSEAKHNIFGFSKYYSDHDGIGLILNVEKKEDNFMNNWGQKIKVD